MAIIQSGNSVDQVSVDNAQKAARASKRPLEIGVRGSYNFGARTGILGVGSFGDLFQFRWTDPYLLAIISKIRVSAAVSTTRFAAGPPIILGMRKANTWVTPGTGGTAITPLNNLKLRKNMTPTLMGSHFVDGDMRIATTTPLGEGTRTNEGPNVATVMGGAPITGSTNGTIIIPEQFLFQAEIEDGDYPLIFGQNEGFSIHSFFSPPGTGTWTMSVNVSWSEAEEY